MTSTRIPSTNERRTPYTRNRETTASNENNRGSSSGAPSTENSSSSSSTQSRGPSQVPSTENSTGVRTPQQQSEDNVVISEQEESASANEEELVDAMYSNFLPETEESQPSDSPHSASFEEAQENWSDDAQFQEDLQNKELDEFSVGERAALYDKLENGSPAEQEQIREYVAQGILDLEDAQDIPKQDPAWDALVTDQIQTEQNAYQQDNQPTPITDHLTGLVTSDIQDRVIEELDGQDTLENPDSIQEATEKVRQEVNQEFAGDSLANVFYQSSLNTNSYADGEFVVKLTQTGEHPASKPTSNIPDQSNNNENWTEYTDKDIEDSLYSASRWQDTDILKQDLSKIDPNNLSTGDYEALANIAAQGDDEAKELVNDYVDNIFDSAQSVEDLPQKNIGFERLVAQRLAEEQAEEGEDPSPFTQKASELTSQDLSTYYSDSIKDAKGDSEVDAAFESASQELEGHLSQHPGLTSSYIQSLEEGTFFGEDLQNLNTDRRRADDNWAQRLNHTVTGGIRSVVELGIQGAHGLVDLEGKLLQHIPGGNIVTDFRHGVIDGAAGIIQGAQELLINPVGTLKGIGEAVLSPIDTAKGIYNDYKELYEEYGAAGVAGSFVPDIVASIFTGGGAKAAGLSGRLARFARVLDNIPSARTLDNLPTGATHIDDITDATAASSRLNIPESILQAKNSILENTAALKNTTLQRLDNITRLNKRIPGRASDIPTGRSAGELLESLKDTDRFGIPGDAELLDIIDGNHFDINRNGSITSKQLDADGNPVSTLEAQDILNNPDNQAYLREVTDSLDGETQRFLEENPNFNNEALPGQEIIDPATGSPVALDSRRAILDNVILNGDSPLAREILGVPDGGARLAQKQAQLLRKLIFDAGDQPVRLTRIPEGTPFIRSFDSLGDRGLTTPGGGSYSGRSGAYYTSVGTATPGSTGREISHSTATPAAANNNRRIGIGATESEQFVLESSVRPNEVGGALGASGGGAHQFTPLDGYLPNIPDEHIFRTGGLPTDVARYVENITGDLFGSRSQQALEASRSFLESYYGYAVPATLDNLAPDQNTEDIPRNIF